MLLTATTVTATLVTVGMAVAALASAQDRRDALIVALALLPATAFAAANPIRIPTLPSGGISLAPVFIVAGGVLYGWELAALLALAGCAIPGIAHRLLADRAGLLSDQLVFGIAAKVLAGAAAGLASAVTSSATTTGATTARSLAAAATFYATNLLFESASAAVSGDRSFPSTLATIALGTAVPAVILAPSALTLAVLWQRSPFLSLALVGPLVASFLQGRSAQDAFLAKQLALTDAITGLGNQRAFRDRLRRDLELAQEKQRPLSLALIDLDDFKDVNDRFGHPRGDRVLGQIAVRLRHGGEAFRLGGDEFALILPERSSTEAMEIVEAVLRRLHEPLPDHESSVAASAGVATFPDDAASLDGLLECADLALYAAKSAGKRHAATFEGMADAELGLRAEHTRASELAPDAEERARWGLTQASHARPRSS